MIKVIGNLDKYTPIKKMGEVYQICWDLKSNGKVGSWMKATISSVKQVKSFILNYYNNQIDNKILKDFKWNGHSVWLSTENQFNYKAAYDLAIQTQGKSLPVTFKFGTTLNPSYYTFETLDDLQDFYIKAISFINDTLREGWKIKDSINWKDYEV